ncbi:MAG: PAS domain-containing protein [Calothrix sp. C42_A2020_038]|nr:PAS domain-containing protein [Calothrix sp. C42_A2020_038]
MQIQEQATRHFVKREALQRGQVQLLSTIKDRDKEQLLTLLKIALSNTGLGLWEWNLASSQLDFDSCSENILGYKPNQIPDCQSFQQLVHPHDISKLIQARNDYLQNPASIYEVEFRILSHSGWKWIIERVVTVLHDKSLRASLVIGTYQDVTVQKSLELTVRQQQVQKVLLERIIKILDRCSSSVDLDYALQTVAEQVQKFLHTQQVVIHRIETTATIQTAPAHCIIASNEFNSTSKSNQTSLAVPILISHPNQDDALAPQHILWGMLIANDDTDKLTWEQSEINTLKIIAREIGKAIQKFQLLDTLQTLKNERTLLETQANERLEQIQLQSEELAQIRKQLLKKERIATLGELIDDLVKEIYDPVEFIFNALNSASQYAEDLIQLLEYYQYCQPTSFVAPPQLACLDINFIKTDFIKLLWSLRASSERLQQTVKALYKFSHFNHAQSKKTDLNAALDGAVTILQHRLKQKPNRPGIEVVKQFGDIPLVECIPGELNQVFISLLINAIEALEERIKYDQSFIPKICISTKIIHSHLSLINSERAVSKQKKVLIYISDNGKGILPHIQRRMFEPFFTTKPIGTGTGLGLAISKQIVEENHRGKLRCNSQLGHGTEFVIEICTKDKHHTDIRKHASF